MSNSNPPKKKMDGNPDANLLSVGNYNFGKTLGEGNFAKVKLAKHKLTGQEVAIKIIDKTSLDEKKLSKLYREVRVMKLLHHPNIVKLFEVIETKHTIFLVMEMVSGGELYDYLVVHGRMKEKEARAKFRQIISAVHYCHSKRVIHRDLKAENLLLDSNLDIKIADFGFSNQFDPDGKLDTFCGSPPYAAPELFQGKRYTGPEVDVWSLGVILYVLSTGCLPFDGKNLQEMRESVCRAKYRIPFYLSEGCEKLLRKFLVRDPTKRPSLDVIMDDPWLNEGFDGPPFAPISQFDQAGPEDELVLTVMETKFGIEKDVVRKGIKENIYDEVMAIYSLLYSEKQKNGEAAVIKIGEQMAVKNPHAAERAQQHLQAATQQQQTAIGAIREIREEGDSDGRDNNNIILLPNPTDTSKRRPSLSGTASPTPTLKARDSIGGNNGNNGSAPPQVAYNTPVSAGVTTNAGGALARQASPAVAANAVPVRRNRRFTVANEVEAKAFEDDKDAGALDRLKNMRITDTSAPNGTIGRGDGASTRGRPASMAVPSNDAQNGAAAGKTDRAINPDKKPLVETRRRTNTLTGFLKLGRNDAQTTAAAENNQQPSNYSNDEGSAESVETSSSDEQPRDDSKPRSLRFTFNSNTTSSKQPDEIVSEVLTSCAKLSIRTRNTSRYVMECLAAPPNNIPGAEPVKIEIEICKLPRLKNLHGLKFKRLSGASADYKVVCEQILAGVAL